MTNINTPKYFNRDAAKVIMDNDIDYGIRYFVYTLNKEGIKTFESCEGGEGHGLPEPFVGFHGNKSTVYKAIGICLEHNLPIAEIAEVISIQDNTAITPVIRITFSRKQNENESRFIDEMYAYFKKYPV